MKDEFYCPRCDSMNVRTTAGKVGGKVGAATDSLISSGSVAFGLFWARANRKRYENYIPIYHHCENCGHTFLSLETNLEELRRAHLNKKSGTTIAVCWGLLGISLCIGSSGKIGSILFGVLAICLAAFGVVNAVNSGKAITELNKQLKELEQCREKHKPLF